MTSQSTDMPLCACGCGEHVATPGARWKRGHFHRGENAHLQPLPGPDDDIDLGEEIDLGEPPELPRSERYDREPGESDEDFFRRVGIPLDDEIPPDAPPADLSDAKGRRKRGAPRVTSAMRKDIASKISLSLEIPGQIWKARDPFCGGAFIRQRPAIADALTDIVCDSADLVDFFTGPAGSFMKYLKLAAALQPVVTVAYGHHVAHTIGEDEQGQQQRPDMSRYAA